MSLYFKEEKKTLTIGLESTAQEIFTVCLRAALITVDSAEHTGGSVQNKKIRFISEAIKLNTVKLV